MTVAITITVAGLPFTAITVAIAVAIYAIA
jgi:hypothetical protein